MASQPPPRVREIDPSSWSTLPEVHYPEGRHDEGLPEVHHHDYDFPEAVGGTPPKFYVDQSESPEQRHSHPAALGPGKGPKVGWWRRRWVRIIGGVVTALVVIVVAVAVGVVVSQRNSRETPQSKEQEQRGNKTENGPAPSATAQAQLFGTPTTFPEPNGIVPASPCTGTVCPQYLASVNMMNSNASFLFGRGTDSAIWYREITDSSWNGDWKTLGGIFDSQPAAISMRDGRVDVFGTWKDDSTRYKTYQDGAWEGDWTSLSGVAKSQPVVCSIGWDNMIVSAIGMGNGVWRKMTGDGGESWDPNGRTIYWEENGGPVNKSLGTVCVPYADDSDAYFAEAGCGPKPDEELNYRMWNSSSKFYTNFTAWSAGGVPCMGDPTLVSFLDDITYFVVGSTDLAIWTFSALRSTGKITKTGMSLGGRFQSVVDVFTTGSSRMDLFAVGIDTRLKHMAYIEGKGWAPDWDDLGGYFNSAPKAVRLNDTAVAVFGIGPDGNIIHSVFSIGGGTDFVLGSQQWYTDGGEISTVIS